MISLEESHTPHTPSHTHTYTHTHTNTHTYTHTYTHTHTHTHTHSLSLVYTNFEDKSNFNKPGMCQSAARVFL